MPTRWLQEQPHGSKNDHGMPPRRASRGYNIRIRLGLFLCDASLTSKMKMLKGVRDFCLKAKPRIWSWLSYMCHIHPSLELSYPRPRAPSYGESYNLKIDWWTGFQPKLNKDVSWLTWSQSLWTNRNPDLYELDGSPDLPAPGQKMLRVNLLVCRDNPLIFGTEQGQKESQGFKIFLPIRWIFDRNSVEWMDLTDRF